VALLSLNCNARTATTNVNILLRGLFRSGVPHYRDASIPLKLLQNFMWPGP
jgi:hypothetical protein